MFTPLFKPVRAKTKVYFYLNYRKLSLVSPGIIRLRKGFKEGKIFLDTARPPLPLSKGLDDPPPPPPGFANN